MLSLSHQRQCRLLRCRRKTTTLSASWSQSGLAGAERLGLSGSMGATLDAMAQGKLPDGTELSRIVNGKETHRAGYDLTFSAPKSVSVMALVAGDKRFLRPTTAPWPSP